VIVSVSRGPLIMPLTEPGAFAWAVGIRQRDLLDRLADERDALVIPEVAS
jgi:hypothetical protein